MSRGRRGILAFDCDGVLLDSNTFKTDCFRRTLSAFNYSAALTARFVAHQKASFGTSRYRLFAELLSWDHQPEPAPSLEQLLASFAGDVRAGYVAVPQTPDLDAVLDGLQPDWGLVVVSGSDEAELIDVLTERGLARRFAAIYGSPATKLENLQRAARDVGEHLPPSSFVFIGDAEADYNAARSFGARFVYMDAYSTAQSAMRALAATNDFPVIADLRQLPAALETLSQPEHRT